MKFGLAFELSVPRPFTNGIEREVYMRSLEQARLGDQLGFDQAWVVEHHFMEEYSHSSGPDLFLAALAMMTDRIRLCHGIVVCVPEINPAIRVAERAAVLDVLSNGRMELGTGRSGTWTELAGFGVDPEETKKTWDEYVRVIPKMWTQERFSYQGRSFSMPERMVLPKPVQRPHPPMWVAVTAPGTELDAADRGLGSYGVSFSSSLVDQEKRIAGYRKRIQSCDPVGSFVNEQVNTVNFLYCHEDEGIALTTGQKLVTGFSSAAAQVLDIRDSYPTAAYRAPGLLSAIRQEAGAPTDGKKKPEGLCYGTPDQIEEALRRWESVGVDRVVFMVNYLEIIDQGAVLDSMRLFAREVMPRFGQTAFTSASLDLVASSA
ncbi:LLM class flavin-dependent oxidoreductase [Sporichthya sp.]|uniref:LLM class flavin-dependent oxidoreductase n=1 Tax=Sporichthya sp. TaxID=65475 RepID=UPI001816D1D6|nr:LLM class flavin-dependent oxidoreductase [Sporichthya sp.]MBA3743132.1 LLM class flavin-dependent oxidoreductase [Sporichthya sp.]